jgi:hypothetical protein
VTRSSTWHTAHQPYCTDCSSPLFWRAQVREANFPGTDDDWDPTYLHHVLDSTGTKRALSRYGKQALISYVLDRYPTRTTLARWGCITDGMCPHCGKLDTAYHRMHTCTQASMPATMDKHLRRWREHEGMARGILHITPPSVLDYDHSIRYTLFGSDVSKDKFGRFDSRDGQYTRMAALYTVVGRLRWEDGRPSRSLRAALPAA